MDSLYDCRFYFVKIRRNQRWESLSTHHNNCDSCCIDIDGVLIKSDVRSLFT